MTFRCVCGADRDGGRRQGGDRFGGDREDRFERRQEDDGPSRADEAADWGREKKYVSSGGGGGGGSFGGRGGYESRRGGFGDRDDRPPRDEGPSRADEADSWGRKPGAGGFDGGRGGAGDRRYGGGGGGFEDRPPRRDYDLGSAARADEADVWRRREGLPPSEGPARSGGGGGGGDRWGAGGDAPQGGGEGRERPKLNLKPRSVPVDQPAAAAAAGATEGAPPPTRKSDPFGGARPVDVKVVDEPTARCAGCFCAVGRGRGRDSPAGEAVQLTAAYLAQRWGGRVKVSVRPSFVVPKGSLFSKGEFW